MKARSKPAGVQADLSAAARVLDLEAKGIGALAAALDDRLIAALDILGGATGRVVVTGMGKSGHIARKIASTMASVGTPALYVHPGEASHGDLGMITKADAVLALSNSGETPELSDMIAYCKRSGIPLLAITADPKSTLAEQADVALILPPSPEACPLGLAPTTSTTMALALGDALAVALLERKGFSAEDFQVLHPGGRLGRKLLRVADIMHGADEMPLVGPDTVMADALITMTAKRFGCVGVVDGENMLLGIVTDGDLRRHMAPDLLAKTVRAVMTRKPKTIRPQALAGEALGLMNARAITSLFVVEGNRPIGIVHIHDCLREGVA
ncbi:MAG TPA: KpsF/GutQ family sugar-phosphate isomerase [Alphaproteobacteria bacterium]|jgi:arabinose-5-phosphate isomerase|nr:KpsF/GutQ family sugar-phosphate isomerase [Alphaproteobacteria bacterium]